MSTPDVRVRLTAEGVKEVVDALKKVQAEAGRSSRQAAGGVSALTSAAGRLKRTLATLGLGVTAAGLAAFAKSALSAADETGKAAQRIGTTTETLSVLHFAAETADVSQQELASSASILARNLAELERGTERQVQAFARLGLTQRDLAGLDTGQALALIAERMARLPDGVRKTQIALDLLGQSGANLIPLMTDLGARGFATVREEAERFGIVIDSETAAAAEAANDAFTLIGIQARGLAVQFVSGFAPAIVDAMTTFQNETAGKGVNAMRQFGEATGRAIRGVIEIFRLLGTIVGAILEDFGALGAGLGALFRGEFRAAVEILSSPSNLNKVGDAWETFVRTLSRDPPEIEVRVRPTVAPDVELPETNAARRKREAEEEAARKARLKALNELIRKQEAAGEARKAIEREILEATGNERAAKIAALDEELRRRREILREAGALTDEARARLAELQRVSVARIDFDQVAGEGERALEDLARQRQRIQQDVELGIVSEFTGQQRILAIERERLPVLQELAEKAMAAAQASGNPELIAQAEQFGLAVGQVAVSIRYGADQMAHFREAAESAVTADLTNWLADGLEQAESLGDAFRDLARSIIQSLQRIAAEIIAKQAMLALARAFGGGATGLAAGGVVEAATGGLIRGPGGPTADRVPALLSDGEFVVRARAVAQPGMLDTLRAINALELSPLAVKPVRFAEGGEVAAAPQTSARIEGGIQIGLGPGLVAQELATPEATRSLLRVVQKNPNAFRQALGV